MVQRILSNLELNRITLARQLLLEPSSLRPENAVSHLVGLQAQQPAAPFIGLWSRLAGFDPAALTASINDRSIIKATLMRATLHLSAAADFLQFRATLQPVLTKALAQILKKRGAHIDVERLVGAAREFIGAEPRSFAEITSMLTRLHPDEDPGAMRYAVRTHLPLIQVPTEATWSYPGNPKFTLADQWLGQPIPESDHLRELVLGYLTAFGPATVADIQTWSGLERLRDHIDSMRPELDVYGNEQGKVLFDAPGAPMASADSAAPIRFLPEYDNLLRAFQNRSRVIADEHKSRVYLSALRLRSTILVGGFVAGAWSIKTSGGIATLKIEPFIKLAASQRKQLTSIGQDLAAFVEPTATDVSVLIAD